MDNQRYNEWEQDSEVYTANQVEALLGYCDIEVDSETSNGFLSYCPFHNNTDSPAFGINKTTGRWACFNPACNRSGDLMDLLMERKHLNPFEATRLVMKYGKQAHGTIADRLSAIREKAPEFVEFPSEPVERMHEDLFMPIGNHARHYLHN